MKTVWKERTNQGRVVYDRPKHSFGIGDVVRIVSRLLGASIVRINSKFWLEFVAGMANDVAHEDHRVETGSSQDPGKYRIRSFGLTAADLRDNSDMLKELASSEIILIIREELE